MNDALLVHLYVFFINFCASVVQGMTGFGDAVVLNVCWYIASVANPDVFNHTPFGPSPVSVVALFMYVRIIFFAPLVAFLSLKKGVFSWSLTLAMGIPSLVFATIGVVIFTRVQSGDTLKFVLGISSLIFAILYVCILLAKYILRRSRGGLAARSTGRGESAQEGGAEFPAHAHHTGREATAVLIAAPTSAAMRAEDPFDSARSPRVDSSPPVSPAASTPSARRSRNRNFNPDGSIKYSTKIGAGIASAVTGIMVSLTGVGAPAQIIYILLLDIPQSLNTVNYAVQSIPSALVRFVMAFAYHLFHREMIPIFLTTLVAGYLGVYAGTRLGNALGPRAYSVFVLAILLLSSMMMITSSATLLCCMAVSCTVLTVVAAVYERRQAAAVEQAVGVAVVGHGAASTERARPAVATTAATDVTVVGGGAHHGREAADADVDADSAVGHYCTPLGCSSRTSSTSGRVRKADLLRPPSLFNTPASSPRNASLAAVATVRVPREVMCAEESIARRTSSANEEEELPM